MVMLALHGIDAFGLEVSRTAVDVAKDYAAQELSKSAEDPFPRSRPVTRSLLDGGRGAVRFVVGNFFSSDWEGECQRDSDEPEAGFDLIYDYTVGLEVWWDKQHDSSY